MRFILFVTALIVFQAPWARAENDAHAETEMPKITFHGGTILEYYRPQEQLVDEYFGLYYLYVKADTTFEDFGFHAEARFSETPFRSFYTSNFWFEENYFFYKQPNFVVKLGKEYTHFGRFTDGSYFGNILYFDGLKISPDDGISWEGQIPEQNLKYYLQYFPQDGSTNGALDGSQPKTKNGADSGVPPYPYYPDMTGRDTITIPGGHRRNEIIGRLEPSFKMGESVLTSGISYEYLLADIPLTGNYGPRRVNVHRWEVDLELTNGPWSIFFEYDRQKGQTVVDYPFQQEGSTRVDYYWAGTKYKHGKWTFFYNHSDALYKTQSVHDVTDVPGFTYQFRSYLKAQFEYGYWYRTQGPSFHPQDNSLNFYLIADI